MDRNFDDSPREECGVLGINAPEEEVARLAFFGLFALQHRGQEAAGMVVSDGQMLRLYKDIGLVSQVFKEETLASLPGSLAIGHARYSTSGASVASNAQPFMIDTRHGIISLAHNGNLVNAAQLRKELMAGGVGFSSTSDTEVMTMMLAGANGKDWLERISNVMRRWVGAFSLVILIKDAVFAVRDPLGFRPLSVGELPSGGHAVASETGALRTLGCRTFREVRPGEIIKLEGKRLISYQGQPELDKTARCIFENIYFSRPDGVWDGLNIHQLRQHLGEVLADETGIEADVVIPVPDSSIPAAIGFSRRIGLPYNDGFIKNRYIGRTFIEPTDSLRKLGIALKFNVVNENVAGKRVIMIDDSIVRGNTSGALVRLMKEAGAKEVHLRITSPPIRHPCFMGVDMGTYEELIAHKLDVDEICAHTGADSLQYLSLEGLMRANKRAEGYCTACFTGDYPVEVPSDISKNSFEQNGVCSAV